MRANKIDLHIHSDAGIGEYPASGIFADARQKNLGVISITDLDTVRAYFKVNQNDADYYNLKLVRGVEISANNRQLNLWDIRLLAYNFLLHHRGLNSILSANHKYRVGTLRAKTAGGPQPRPDWGFGLADVKDVLRQVKDAGGISFLDPSSVVADMGTDTSDMYEYENFSRLVSQLKNFGLDGMEVSNGRITPGQSAYLNKLAADCTLMKSCGSGFIGLKKTPDISIGKCYKDSKLVKFVQPVREEAVRSTADITDFPLLDEEMDGAFSLYKE